MTARPRPGLGPTEIVFSPVWLANGLLAKLLGLVPRPEEVVARRLLGPGRAAPITILIGCSEILLAIWVASRFFPRVCAWTQILLVLTMNIVEFLFAADLLLWGRFNIVLAAAFVLAIQRVALAAPVTGREN